METSVQYFQYIHTLEVKKRVQCISFISELDYQIWVDFLNSPNYYLFYASYISNFINKKIYHNRQYFLEIRSKTLKTP